MRAALPARLEAHLDEARLLQPGDAVLVALSGGRDSVVLLHLLRFALPGWQLRLHAAHFDHRMRPESGRDAAWVRGLCRAWGIPLESGAAERPLRGEDQARRARYTFLRQAATRSGSRVVVTAHHRDDQAETVLFRLARGTGLPGLAGIPARRGLLVRPLLPFTRAELLAYARAHGIRYREDASNAQSGPARNRIRHLLLPALEARRPGAAARLAELAGLAAMAENAWADLLPGLLAEVLERQEGDRFLLARDRLLDYDPRVRARVIRYCAAQLGSVPGRAATRVALSFLSTGRSGHAVPLPGGLLLERAFDQVILYRPDPGAARRGNRPLAIGEAGSGVGRVWLGGEAWDVAWGPGPGEPPDSLVLDPGQIDFPLEVREWRPGDRMVRPNGSRKLKQIFAEHRVPRPTRHALPVLAEQAGRQRVLWVAGVAQAAGVAPSHPGAGWHITVRHERES